MNGRVNGRASEDNNEMYINKQTKKKENKKTYKYTYTLYIRYRKFIQKKKMVLKLTYFTLQTQIKRN